jgi:hypothetical protein
MFNFKLWGRGIIAALIGGATTGAIDALSNGDLKGAGKTAAVGALVGALLYLKSHPVPPEPSEPAK